MTARASDRADSSNASHSGDSSNHPALDLAAFIDASPSPFHACAEAARRLEAVGFVRVSERDRWASPADSTSSDSTSPSASPSPSLGAGTGVRQYVIRDGSLVAWWIPEGRPGRDPATPFRIIGAHTDSPNFRIKPQPDGVRVGWRQLGVEVYGSPLFNSWLDRDLGLSGRVMIKGANGPEARLVLIDRPLLRIPQLAIHLDRGANEGLTLNPQQHLVPVWGLSTADGRNTPDEASFVEFLAHTLDIDPGAILGWDVMTHDLTPGCLLGSDNQLLSCPRLDNLCSAWAATSALVASVANGTERSDLSPLSPAVQVVCLFDHEEVGSTSNSGAGSPLLVTLLERLVLARGGDREHWHQALAGSHCVSSDMAHATHPNYPERHEPHHHIAANGGPVLKINANQRYASDAGSEAPFVAACERAGVPLQRFVNRNDLPCGSTIGPITASRLGIPVVDVGAPQLSMHSARELMGADDPGYLRLALSAYLRGPMGSEG